MFNQNRVQIISNSTLELVTTTRVSDKLLRGVAGGTSKREKNLLASVEQQRMKNLLKVKTKA